jgi:hypothetical protein
MLSTQGAALRPVLHVSVASESASQFSNHFSSHLCRRNRSLSGAYQIRRANAFIQHNADGTLDADGFALQREGMAEQQRNRQNCS